MVSLKEIRAHNASLKSLSSGLVGVFVGGTSGIGFNTAREFVRNTSSPHVYLIGRNEAEAARIIPELQSINPTSKVDFIKSDVSLLKSVDEVCQQIQQKEKKVNLLFMTIGVMTMKGRDPTSEGLDRKFALHYYSRMRFVQNLSPLLTAAAKDADPQANLSRVVSVLDAKIGRKYKPNFSDLALEHTFSLSNCMAHATSMNNYALEHFAQLHPETSYIHAYPSGVNTNILRNYPGIVRKVLSIIGSALLIDPQESGERHLFAATAPRYAPRAMAGANGADAKGKDANGAYKLDWDGEILDETNVSAELRANGAAEKIWKHTADMFTKIRG